MQLNPYLTFNGNCEEAFKAYRDPRRRDRRHDPARGHAGRRPRPGQWRKKILHARLVGNGMVLMGSDAPPERYRADEGLLGQSQL